MPEVGIDIKITTNQQVRPQLCGGAPPASLLAAAKPLGEAGSGRSARRGLDDALTR